MFKIDQLNYITVNITDVCNRCFQIENNEEILHLAEYLTNFKGEWHYCIIFIKVHYFSECHYSLVNIFIIEKL